MLLPDRPALVFLSATQLDRRLARVIEAVVEGRRVVVTCHGRAVAALISIADFEAFTGKPLETFSQQDLDLIEASSEEKT